MKKGSYWTWWSNPWNNFEYDEFRDFEMDNLGIHILRLKNEELLNMNETLQKIEYF